ncbi:hypothetical protein OAS39_06250, partial [Pirellulales bacterium]|nr:hypothetical protein [Pirellulales bacterium]
TRPVFFIFVATARRMTPPPSDLLHSIEPCGGVTAAKHHREHNNRRALKTVVYYIWESLNPARANAVRISRGACWVFDNSIQNDFTFREKIRAESGRSLVVPL